MGAWMPLNGGVVEQYWRQVGLSDGKRILLRNRQHLKEYHRRAEEDEQDIPMALTHVPTPTTCAEITRNNTHTPMTGLPA